MIDLDLSNIMESKSKDIKEAEKHFNIQKEVFSYHESDVNF